MKIGDKVRFLSEVGGGRVSGFQGKDIVLVEDEDGFDIPMLRTQVVVIDTDDYNIVRKTTKASAEAVTPSAEPVQKQQVSSPTQSSDDPSDGVITFKAKPVERRGGDLLNLYLAFVPDDVKLMNTTAFEAYLVNDSNYYVQVLYLNASGTNWRMRCCTVIEPNCKQFVEAFDRSVLNDLERVCVQAIAWKQDKDFVLKPAVSAELRLDVTKFYKLHTFQPNEFFRDPNWTVPVVKDDKPVRTMFVDADQLKEAIMEKKEADKPKRVDDKPLSKPHAKPAAIEVDLHIEQLLDTTAGLSNGDMLMTQMNEFRRVMDAHLKEKGAKIVFIHGKGDGVLRKSILQELKYRYKSCTFQDASFREYGFGATMVVIH
ncbi:MAG: DUF2027 domain-containing protein [Bacteroidaceae bacterium]|nr:DUF2027 domain-containing protein [Bacteroidaceae bacterium]